MSPFPSSSAIKAIPCNPAVPSPFAAASPPNDGDPASCNAPPLYVPPLVALENPTVGSATWLCCCSSSNPCFGFSNRLEDSWDGPRTTPSRLASPPDDASSSTNPLLSASPGGLFQALDLRLVSTAGAGTVSEPPAASTSVWFVQVNGFRTTAVGLSPGRRQKHAISNNPLGVARGEAGAVSPRVHHFLLAGTPPSGTGRTVSFAPPALFLEGFPAASFLCCLGTRSPDVATPIAVTPFLLFRFREYSGVPGAEGPITPLSSS